MAGKGEERWEREAGSFEGEQCSCRERTLFFSLLHGNESEYFALPSSPGI